MDTVLGITVMVLGLATVGVAHFTVVFTEDIMVVSIAHLTTTIIMVAIITMAEEQLHTTMEDARHTQTIAIIDLVKIATQEATHKDKAEVVFRAHQHLVYAEAQQTQDAFHLTQLRDVLQAQQEEHQVLQGVHQVRIEYIARAQVEQEQVHHLQEARGLPVT